MTFWKCMTAVWGPAGAFLLLLVLVSCNAQTVRMHIDMSSLTYQQDARTGECYAVVGHTEGGNMLGNSKGFTITWVPCDPKVLTAITDDAR
jgi:hypothetical protein